jgi:hypothetical protein
LFSKPWKNRRGIFQALVDTIKVAALTKPPYGGATNGTAKKLGRL